MGMPKHAQFIARTVMVQNQSLEKAAKLLHYVMGKEEMYTQYRKTRYYEKPTQTRRRVNFEICRAIYTEDMTRKIRFILKTYRKDPYPGAS